MKTITIKINYPDEKQQELVDVLEPFLDNFLLSRDIQTPPTTLIDKVKSWVKISLKEAFRNEKRRIESIAISETLAQAEDAAKTSAEEFTVT